MAKRRRRRNWSDDEKRMICAQTRFPGVSVSQVARRYDVNANQVFNWLKDPAFASPLAGDDVTRFLPVEVVEPVRPQGACLFSKRLEKGRFVWPSPADGKISVTSAQLAMLLEGIDWRMPKRTWRPLTAGNLSTNPAQ